MWKSGQVWEHKKWNKTRSLLSIAVCLEEHRLDLMKMKRRACECLPRATPLWKTHSATEWREKEIWESWRKTVKPLSHSQWRHLRWDEHIVPGFHPQSFQDVRDVLKECLSPGTHCSLRYKSECLGLKEAKLDLSRDHNILWHFTSHLAESVSARYPTKSLGQMGLY